MLSTEWLIVVRNAPSQHRSEVSAEIESWCEDLAVGTAIELSLNGIVIDWGKSRYWHSRHWLFPPGSLTHVRYPYSDDATETQPGFHTTLNEAYFRLRHLGYSQQETKTKFDAALAHWNRTATLRLTFAGFRSALITVDFASLTPADMKPYIWGFRGFVLNQLSEIRHGRRNA